MADAGDFQYVDFATRALPGFRNNVVRVGDVPELVGRYGRAGCFCTYFLFDKELPEYVKQNHDSMAGYGGPCYARFLPLDVDGSDVERALGATRQIARFFLDRWGVPEEAAAIYYSGMKGFHVTLATGVFGEVRPGVGLPRIFHGLRRSVVEMAKVTHPEAVDFGISDRLRLLRLPNTKHSKSGLYKVPLRVEELLSCEPEKIRDIARKPRTPWLTDESGLMPRYGVGPVSGAVDLFRHCSKEAENDPRTSLPDPGSFLGSGDLKEALCEAELALYREGVPEGSRSAVGLRLASRFRSAGYDEEEACEMLDLFAGRCSPPLDARAAKHVVTAAYRTKGRGYQFGCGKGLGDPPQSALVYERCDYRNDRMQCETFRRFYSQLNGNGKGGG